MRYKAGDKFEKTESLEIIEVMASYYVTKDDNGRVDVWGEEELSEDGFCQPTKVHNFPLEGTLVKVWDINEEDRRIRVCARQPDGASQISVYGDGRYRGAVVRYDNWELV